MFARFLFVFDLLFNLFKIALWPIVMIRFEIIAKRGIIARLRYNTSFGLYEKLEFLTFFNVLAATQKSRMLPLLAHINGVRPKFFSSKHRRKVTRHYGK